LIANRNNKSRDGGSPIGDSRWRNPSLSAKPKQNIQCFSKRGYRAVELGGLENRFPTCWDSDSPSRSPRIPFCGGLPLEESLPLRKKENKMDSICF